MSVNLTDQEIHLLRRLLERTLDNDGHGLIMAGGLNRSEVVALLNRLKQDK